jgi:hypothetical protein
VEVDGTHKYFENRVLLGCCAASSGKVKVKLTLQQASKARWCGWSTPRPGRFTPGKDPVSII